jgi:CheY-like chemotaxis protein
MQEGADMARILIVDDDPICRAIASEALTAAGHDCDEAEDGDVGLSRLRAKAFDLVVTDLLMPNKEGIETILEIRQDWPATRIIAMSSNAGQDGGVDLLSMAGRLGADATIAKPIRPARLVEVVRQVLAGEI